MAEKKKNQTHTKPNKKRKQKKEESVDLKPMPSLL